MLTRLVFTAGAVVAFGQEAVLKLTGDNFDSTLSENKFVLVKFFAPWCGHCKSMAPEYEKAASMLKEKEVPVVLGEVDATVEQPVAAKYDVQGYPTLYWFVNGNKRDYGGPRTADGIVEWVNENMGPALKTWSEDDAAAALKARTHGEAIFLFSGDSAVEAVAAEAADSGKVAGTIAYKKSSKKSLTVYRGAAEEASYSGAYELEAVNEWAGKERAPFFGQINEDNFEVYVDYAKKGLFWVCLDPATREETLKTLAPQLEQAAKAQPEDAKYPFVWLDIGEFEAHAKEELGCVDYPTIVLQKGDLLGDREDTKVAKFVRSFASDPASLTSGAVATFFEDITSGKLEAAPEPDELADLDEEEDMEDDGEADAAEDKEEL